MVGNTQHGMHVTNNCSLGYYILQSLVYQKKKKQVTQEHRSPRVSNYPFGEVKKYNKRVVGHPRTAMFLSLLLVKAFSENVDWIYENLDLCTLLLRIELGRLIQSQPHIVALSLELPDNVQKL